MNISTGAILLTISASGLGLALLTLPTPPHLPGWIFGILIATSLAGCFAAANKNNRESALNYTAFTLAIFWMLMNQYNTILAGAQKIAASTAVQLNPASFVNMLYIITGMIVVSASGIGYHVLKNSRLFSGTTGTLPAASLFEWFKNLFNRNREPSLDIVLCKDVATGRDVILTGKDRRVSLAIIGSTGSGKTESIMLPMIAQDLEKIRRGMKIALTVLEPTKDLTDRVAEICEKLGLPYNYIDPTNPDSKRFNIIQGEKEIAAEATRSVLVSLFGKQHSFFSQVQQTASRNTVLLLKEIYGNDVDIYDVIRTLRDPHRLQAEVDRLQRMKGNTDLVQYFNHELLGDMAEKYQQFAAGLRQQLEDIGGNAMLKRVMAKPSDVDLDVHLREGGILIVNTAMGDLLKKLSEVFGQYMLIHLIYALFRKPKAYWNVPHAFYIDELPKYLGPDVGFDDLLAIGRKYGNLCTFAMQSTSQLTIKLGNRDFTRVILNNARSKIVFGGMDALDAKYFEEEFGKNEVEAKDQTFENKVIAPSLWAKSYRITKKLEPRYPYTKLMELEEYQFIYRILHNARLQPPRQGKNIPVDIEKLNPDRQQINIIQAIKNSAHKIQSRLKPEPPVETKPVEGGENRPAPMQYNPATGKLEFAKAEEQPVITEENTRVKNTGGKPPGTQKPDDIPVITVPQNIAPEEEDFWRS